MSAGINTSLLRNNPVWDNEVTSEQIVLTGGTDVVPLQGIYTIISNIGANNITITPVVAVAGGAGILVVPGGSFETATKPSSTMGVIGTVGQSVVVLTYR